jgi:hypothetical protein
MNVISFELDTPRSGIGTPLASITEVIVAIGIHGFEFKIQHLKSCVVHDWYEMLLLIFLGSLKNAIILFTITS